MDKRIKYFCYYDIPDALVNRGYVLAATNKLNYIWSVLNRAGYSVDAISVSVCNDIDFRYVKGSVISLNDNNTLRLFPSMGGSKLIRVLGRYLLWFSFIWWFLLNVKKNEKIIVYHSLGYCRLFTTLKRLTGCCIIGEIEEIYQDVSPQKKSVCKSEFEFFDKCDAYIFPTHLLHQKLNELQKPYVIIHGVYDIEASRNVRWDDSDIHIVYAGTFDSNKGGAAAAAAAAFLPKGYHIHICGFGNETDTEFIKRIIEETDASSQSKVTYDGLIKGEEFILFLQKCHIGLCTQNPDAAFNATSFPSKILTYLANGLHVVSIRIPAIELSGVGKCISYYDEQTPERIADAILSVNNTTDRTSIKTLELLDKQFEADITRILNL